MAGVLGVYKRASHLWKVLCGSYLGPSVWMDLAHYFRVDVCSPPALFPNLPVQAIQGLGFGSTEHPLELTSTE